jgi:hypothetical protein
MNDQVDAMLMPAAVMWTIGRIADRDGISKQAVSKKVKRLVENHGLAVTRDSQSRVETVNVAGYDHLRDKFGDPSKAQGPRQASQPGCGVPSSTDELPPTQRTGDSYEEAKRQQAWIDAERARMRLAEDKKELLRAPGVNAALFECGGNIARIIDRLPIGADDITAAAGREGAHGVRIALKAMARTMRCDIAKALAAIASDAPEFEPAENTNI